jgi:hypothetical protein
LISGQDGTEIISSNGEIAGINAAQAFTYTTIVTNMQPLNVIVHVGNTLDGKYVAGGDYWNLQITVQNPFSIDPSLIVKHTFNE